MFKQMFQQELRKTYKFMPKKRNDIEGHFAKKICSPTVENNSTELNKAP